MQQNFMNFLQHALLFFVNLFLNVTSQENNGNGESNITAEFYFVKQNQASLTYLFVEDCARQCIEGYPNNQKLFCYGVVIKMLSDGTFSCVQQTNTKVPSLKASDSYMVLGEFPFANGLCDQNPTLGNLPAEHATFDDPQIRIWQNKVYYFFGNPLLNYTDCQDLCAKWNAHLPTITSQGEDNFLRNVSTSLELVTKVGSYFNIRFPLNIRTFPPDANGTNWEWRDGTNTTFSNWDIAKNEPNYEDKNKAVEECGGMRGDRPYWADYVCNTKVNCVCEDNGK